MTKWNNFFTDLSNTRPYLKLGAEGAAGSGKTYSLALLAAGLHAHIGSTKPIVIYDTERSAKFLKPFFAGRKIPVLLKESRTLSDLAATMDYCDAGNADILIIDSITHVWEGFLAAYQAEKKRKFLQFQDWGTLKPLWKKEYSDRLVLGRCHILFTGREGFTYDHELNEETGKKELVKTGVKMRVEGETAYEPDLLIRMERFERILGEDKQVWREATILKDRSNLIDGKTFKNPTFKDFQPVVDFLLSDPADTKNTESQSDASMFTEEDTHREYNQQRKILLERNTDLVDEVAAGTSGAAKTLKLSLLKYAYYGETSETAIAGMTAAELEEGNRRLNEMVPIVKKILGGEPLVYPVAKAITAARAKYLGEEYVDDIVAAGLEKLAEYRDHIIAKYKEQQEEAKAKAAEKAA